MAAADISCLYIFDDDSNPTENASKTRARFYL